MKQKILVIDFSQIAFSTFFVNQGQLINSWDFWRYLVLQTIQAIIHTVNPNEVVLACDFKSWRTKVFSYYKGQRKKSRNDNPELTETLFSEMDKFKKELRESFPYKMIEVEYAEGDDVMAIIAQKFENIKDIVIASGDKDLLQLESDSIKIYHPIKNEFRHRQEDKQTYLLKMILKGDSTDGIPNILSDGDTFMVEEKRQKNFGDKAIEKVLAAGFDQWIQEQDEIVKENFKRNKQLIDLCLDIIPLNLQEKVMMEYLKVPENQPQKILDYFTKHQMQSLYESVDKFLLNGQKSGLSLKISYDFSEVKTDIPQNVESLFS